MSVKNDTPGAVVWKLYNCGQEFKKESKIHISYSLTYFRT